MKLQALGGKGKFNPKKLGKVLPIALVGVATVSMGVFFMSGRDTAEDSEASSPPPVCGYVAGECQKVGEPAMQIWRGTGLEPEKLPKDYNRGGSIVDTKLILQTSAIAADPGGFGSSSGGRYTKLPLQNTCGFCGNTCLELNPKIDHKCAPRKDDGSICTRVGGTCTKVATIQGGNECKPVFTPPVYRATGETSTGWWNFKGKRPVKIGGGTWECSDSSEETPPEGKCGFCGASCIRRDSKMMCPMIARADGATCEEQNGKCTVIPTVITPPKKEDQCGWCGTTCTKIDPRMACPAVMPPDGQDCIGVYSGGRLDTCVVKGVTPTIQPPPPSQKSAEINLETESKVFNINEAIDIQVKLNTGEYSAMGIEVVLTYPIEELEIQKVSLGNDFPIVLSNATYTNGEIKFTMGAALGTEGKKGDYTIATITVLPKKVTLGSSTIKVDSATEVTASNSANSILSGTEGLTYTIVSNAVSCGNIDGDSNGSINIQDFSTFSQMYQKECTQQEALSSCGGRDSNDDGIVDIKDFVAFSKVYGQSCSKLAKL